jgi:hypothetical protein
MLVEIILQKRKNFLNWYKKEAVLSINYRTDKIVAFYEKRIVLLSVYGKHCKIT